MFLQTDSETKLLYCWMLRLRISEHGPRTRSKRGRSSLTHFRGPRATTVAARGRFISRAISPATHVDTPEHAAIGTHEAIKDTTTQIKGACTELWVEILPK